MALSKPEVKYPDLENSALHHELKNQPGENGDPDHAKSDGSLSGDVEDAVKDGKGDTALGAALKDVVEDDTK